MVHKGKRKHKKQNKGSNKKVIIQCGDLVYKLPMKLCSDIKIQETILRELKDEIENIYSRYLDELSKRLKSNCFLLSCYEPKDFEFRLSEKKVVELRHKVKKVMKNECIKPIYNIFYITIHKFLADIKKEISVYETRSSESMIICIAESLNSLECSAKELGKITENMPEHKEIEGNCENITKLAFFDKILSKYEFLLLNTPELEKSAILQNMISLLLELKKPQNKENFKFTDSSSETASDYSNKSIDEIMDFIHGKEKSEGNKRKSLTNDSMKGLDLEVEKFKLALDEFEIRNEKLKPNLSDDWISGLKTRIKNYRN